MKYCCLSANARIWKSIVIATMRTMTRSSSEIIASRSVKPRARSARLLDVLGHIIHSLAAAFRADSEIARGVGDVRRYRRDRDHPSGQGSDGLCVVLLDRVADLVGAVLRLHDVRSR